MKRPFLLAVAERPAVFAELFAELAAAGERAGWLELDAADEGGTATTAAGDLEAAAAAGVLRAVAVGGGRVTSVKPVRGEPVLEDLLREHFLGCRVVLVRRGSGLARLAREGSAWRVERPDGGAERLATGELVAGLRRPSFQRRFTGG